MNNRSRHAIWMLITVAALLVAFAPIPTLSSAAPQQRLFRVDASQSSYAPSELRVNPGDTVTIELTSTDAVHGLYLDRYNISVQADPGQTATLTFVADKTGSFRFRCNVTCGALHPFLIGKLTVGGNTLLYRSLGITLLGALGVALLVAKRPERGVLV